MTTVEQTPTQPASQPAATPAAPELPATDGGAPVNADGTPAPQTPAQDPNEPEPKWKGRFSDLTTRARQAEISAAEERGRRLALEDAMQRGLAQPQPQPQPTQAAEQPDPEPNPNDPKYPGKEFDPQYQKDCRAWDRREAERAAVAQFRKEQETQRAEAERQTAMQRGKEQYDEAIALCAQNAEATPNAASTLQTIARTVPNPVVDVITRDDNVHVIAEHFAQRPEDLAALQKTARSGFEGALQAAAFIGRLSHFYALQAQAARPSPQPQPASAVPSVVDVPPPVNGAGGGAPFDPNKASHEEYRRWRMGR